MQALRDFFQGPCKVILTGKGAERELKGDVRDAILAEMVRFLSSGHPMPALGVSLHDETVADMACHPYLIFEFPCASEWEGYPFEALALRVLPQTWGTTFLRRTHGRWQGRCLFWEGTYPCEMPDTLLKEDEA